MILLCVPYAECRNQPDVLGVIMLSVSMLSIIMLTVMASKIVLDCSTYLTYKLARSEGK
jgi:hypothetical protein